MEEAQSRKRTIDWNKCVMCQKHTDEALLSPSNNKRAKKDSGVGTISRNLKEFRRLGKVPRNADVDALDSGPGIHDNLIDNDAKWHKSCYLLCTDSKLQRLKEKSLEENVPPPLTPILTRKSSGLELSPQDNCCIFCLKPGSRSSPLRRVCSDGEKAIKNIATAKGDSKTLVLLQNWNKKNGAWYHTNHYLLYTYI